MIVDSWESWIKFWTKPITLRKTIISISFIAAALTVLIVYERYTASFRLARLQKSVELLRAVHDLQEQRNGDVEADREFARAKSLLLDQAVATIESKPFEIDVLPARLSLDGDVFWKGFVGSLFLAVGAAMAVVGSTEKYGYRQIIATALMVGVGFIGAALTPAVLWPWFHLFVFPCLFIGFVLLAVSPFVFIPAVSKAFARAKERAQSVQCASNLKQIGLAARLWAHDHSGSYPEELELLVEEIGSEKVICCPADANRKYTIINPLAVESNPSSEYAACPVHRHILRVDGSIKEKNVSKTEN